MSILITYDMQKHTYNIATVAPVNHRIPVSWNRYRNLKRVLTSTRLPQGLRLRLSGASVVSTVLFTSSTDASARKSPEEN